MLRLRNQKLSTILNSVIAIFGIYVLADDLNITRKFLLSLADKSKEEYK